MGKILKLSSILIFFFIYYTSAKGNINSVSDGATLVFDSTPASVLVANITKWHNCVAKGTQLIDMAHNGSYITFNVKSVNGGYFTFSSDIATALSNIGCILGYTNAAGDYVKSETLDIANTGSWTNTKNYEWLFYLKADSVYSFKMECIAGSGYALNTFNIIIKDFVPDVSIQDVNVNGFLVVPDTAVYTTEAYFDEDITLNVTANSSTAKISYSATINNSVIPVSNGVINKSDFNNGDVIKVIAKISDGDVDYADYQLIIKVFENKKKQIRGTIEDDGFWTAIENSASTKQWTDYIYTLSPTAASTKFYGASWTHADGELRYGIIANNATATIIIPSYYKINAVSFLGFGAATISLSSEGATITSSENSFNTAANANQLDELKYTINSHTPGTPLIFNVSNTDCKMYIILNYTEVADVTSPAPVSQNINNNDMLSSINGLISVRFNEQIKLSETASATLNGENIKLKIENNVFANSYFFGIVYDNTHTFKIKANSIEDMSGNKYTSDITITFTTDKKPIVTKKVYDFIVGIDGSIDQAISAANAASGSNRYYIFVPNGSYELSGNDGDHMTNLTRSNVSITGQSKDSAIITNTPESYGISNTATIHLKYVSNTYMEDIMLKNNRGVSGAGQQVTLFDRGSKNIFKNVKLYSFQDTYVTGDRSYHEDCDIYGATDYICGGGNAFFQSCLMYNVAPDGNKVTAPATSPDQKWGYVFMNCTINGGGFVLGRPWKDEPKAYYLYTKMNRQPNGTGWEGMSGVKTFFYEYKSMDYSGNLLDLSKRGNSPTSTNTYEPILTDEEASEFTLFNVVGGTEGYYPADYTFQTKAPEADFTTDTAKIIWINDPDALCTVVFKDNKFITCTIDTVIEINEKGIYKIQSANEMGGLGEAKILLYGVDTTTVADTNTTGETTMIENSNFYNSENYNYSKGIYDFLGRKLECIPDKGLYILNGKKYYRK